MHVAGPKMDKITYCRRFESSLTQTKLQHDLPNSQLSKPDVIVLLTLYNQKYKQLQAYRYLVMVICGHLWSFVVIFGAHNKNVGLKPIVCSITNLSGYPKPLSF